MQQLPRTKILRSGAISALAVSLYLLTACGGGGDVAQEPGAKAPSSAGVEVAAVKGQGESSESVKIPVQPSWWNEISGGDRIVIMYSSDVHGEIEPCG